MGNELIALVFLVLLYIIVHKLCPHPIYALLELLIFVAKELKIKSEVAKINFFGICFWVLLIVIILAFDEFVKLISFARNKIDESNYQTSTTLTILIFGLFLLIIISPSLIIIMEREKKLKERSRKITSSAN